MSGAAAKPVEFYFEFASPYAYLASEAIEGFCTHLGVPLRWRPLLLGPLLSRTGARPLFVDGRRGEYARMDCLRWARLHGIPFAHWADAPVNGLRAARAALHLAGRATQAPFIHACYRAHFVDGHDLYDPAVLRDCAQAVGEDAPALLAAIEQPALKERLRAHNEEAWERGVFGAPTFCYGKELVWGNDRLPLLEQLIRSAPA